MAAYFWISIRDERRDEARRGERVPRLAVALEFTGNFARTDFPSSRTRLIETLETRSWKLVRIARIGAYFDPRGWDIFAILQKLFEIWLTFRDVKRRRRVLLSQSWRKIVRGVERFRILIILEMNCSFFEFKISVSVRMVIFITRKYRSNYKICIITSSFYFFLEEARSVAS